MTDRKFVLVTTEFRGVFAGELLQQKEGEHKTTVTLGNARCAIDWRTENGFLELAHIGPNKKSKIGSPAREIILYGVTSIATCTEEAKEKWVSSS